MDTMNEKREMLKKMEEERMVLICQMNEIETQIVFIHSKESNDEEKNLVVLKDRLAEFKRELSTLDYRMDEIKREMGKKQSLEQSLELLQREVAINNEKINHYVESSMKEVYSIMERFVRMKDQAEKLENELNNTRKQLEEMMFS